MLELAHREVQADRPAALGADPAGALPGTGPHLEDVEAGHVAEHPQVGLGVPLRTPHEPDVAEELAVRRLVLVGVAVPVGTVGPARLGLGDGTAFDAYARVDGTCRRMIRVTGTWRRSGGHRTSVRRLDRRSVTRVDSPLAPGVRRFPDRVDDGSLSHIAPVEEHPSVVKQDVCACPHDFCPPRNTFS